MYGVFFSLALLTVPQAMLAGIAATIGWDRGKHGAFLATIIAGVTAVVAVTLLLPDRNGDIFIELGERLAVAAALIAPYFVLTCAIVGRMESEGAEHTALVRGCAFAMFGGAPLTMFAVLNVGCRYYECM